jgi:DNA-directed RNA polymerase subunit H (RpoH/RPB5)
MDVMADIDDTKCTSFLDCFRVPEEDTCVCSPEDLFAIRTTLYHWLLKAKARIVLGLDMDMGLLPPKDAPIALRMEMLHTWKTNFFQERKEMDKRSRVILPTFGLLDNFLTVVAEIDRSKPLRIGILFAKSGSVKKEEIRFYQNYVKQNHFTMCWLMGVLCTPQSKNFLQLLSETETPSMQFVPFAKLRCDSSENVFVPEYEVVDEAWLAEHKLTNVEHNPKLCLQDFACLQTFAEVGSVIRVTTKSATAGVISSYKLVIPQKTI